MLRMAKLCLIKADDFSIAASKDSEMPVGRSFLMQKSGEQTSEKTRSIRRSSLVMEAEDRPCGTHFGSPREKKKRRQS